MINDRQSSARLIKGTYDLTEEENQRKDKVQGFTWRTQKEERDKD